MLSVAPYRIVVLNKKGTTTNLWGPNQEFGFATWLHQNLRDALGVVREHGEVRRSRIARIARNAGGDLVCGILQTGVKGYSSDLVNTDTGALSHQRTVIEAEFIPFFFLVVSPPGQDFAILLLQRFGNLGVKDFLVDPLVQQFGEDHAGFRLRITRLVPADLARQLLDESIIKSIRLIRYEEPGEVSDALGEGFAERTGTVEMTIKARKDGSLPSSPGLLQALLGKKAVNQVYSVENFDYDTIKVAVEANGKRRMIDIGRPNVLTPNVDVTEELATLYGHPTWESLLECFSGFAAETFATEGIDWAPDVELTEDEEAAPLSEQA